MKKGKDIPHNLQTLRHLSFKRVYNMPNSVVRVSMLSASECCLGKFQQASQERIGIILYCSDEKKRGGVLKKIVKL